MSIELTPLAVEEVQKVLTAQTLSPENMLRISILGGGCSGLQYSLGFDLHFDPKVDTKYDFGGVSLITEKKFDLHLDGTVVDFVDTPISKGFSIENPNYPRSFGCAGCGGQ
ncbi:MAG: HesB/IscA family protein [Thermoguttaceae bacterium]